MRLNTDKYSFYRLSGDSYSNV